MSQEEKEKVSHSHLVAAAQAFDEELRRFDRACEASLRRSLDSQKDLERVAAALNEATVSERELGPRAQELLAALNDARERQQEQATAARRRADELESRAKAFTDLMERYRDIGLEAADLNGLASHFAELKREGTGGQSQDELRAGLTDFEGRLAKVSGDARDLADAARAATFEDVAREAHGLHQRLTSLRNKIKLVREGLGLVN